MRELSCLEITATAGGQIGNPTPGVFNAQDTVWGNPGATGPAQDDTWGDDKGEEYINSLDICLTDPIAAIFCLLDALDKAPTETETRDIGNPAGDGWGNGSE